ncbi:hypothetical protein XU18_4324 [Perkinsela sp. CCAP 1560/4]|nr:hypothetical protein XU18_4324 [Perkinsela sp. CCAP 1560/4]|eukprot:KNH04465.1 hypothetical protein XU18_4324 [Perkinsela sp. CCAP 1560/4]
MLCAACLLQEGPDSIFLESSINMIQWVPRMTFSSQDEIFHCNESREFTACLERGISEGKTSFFTRFGTEKDRSKNKVHLLETPIHVAHSSSTVYVILLQYNDIIGIQILDENELKDKEDCRPGATCIRIRRVDKRESAKSLSSNDEVASKLNMTNPQEGKVTRFFYLLMIWVTVYLSVRMMLG